MTSMRQLINLVEAKNREKLELLSLPYKRDQLSPVMSKATIDYHYGELAKSYVDIIKEKGILFLMKLELFYIISFSLS